MLRLRRPLRCSRTGYAIATLIDIAAVIDAIAAITLYAALPLLIIFAQRILLPTPCCRRYASALGARFAKSATMLLRCSRARLLEIAR